MNHYRASSMSSSASTSDLSSPALPELSLDASLQRLHREEDISASSISSVARSQSWVLSTHEQAAGCRSSSPGPTSPLQQSTQARNAERTHNFRFPPLAPAHEIRRSPSPSISPTATHPTQPALPARPRTSRGLGEPKPSVSSSSRATSIASIAEIETQETQASGPRIVYGTPFAGNAFGRGIDLFADDYSETEQQFGPRSEAEDSEGVRRRGSGFSPRQTSTPLHKGPGRVEANRPHALLQTSSFAESLSWTVLFAPLKREEFSTQSQFDESNASILLPLLSSLEAQVEHLRSHLSNSSSKSVGSSDIELFLDLSSVSALPANTLARLTKESWSLTFNRFARQDARKIGESTVETLPYLYRETGLPIVALIRYTLTSPSSSDQWSTRVADEVDTTVSREHDQMTHSPLKPQHQTQDSNPWIRRESELTVSLGNTGRLGASPMMVASRSYPGIPRTPVRRSPLPYSPRTTAYPRDNALVKAALVSKGSSMAYSYSNQERGSHGFANDKLRSLSLAAVHPLNTTEEGTASTFEMTISRTLPKKTSQLASGLSSALGPQDDADDEDEDDVRASSQQGSSPIRQRYQSSRGSSHKSFSSHTTSLSTHSTRSTSIYSSRSRLRAASDADVEEDEDLGSRFWTQLSSLGEQVSRENKEVRSVAGHARGSNSRNVSISSTTSDASSVFSFSPLGILVPTEGALDAETQDTAAAHSILQSSLQASMAFDALHPSPASLQPSGILGRRRAYSSMVPLTGWRAGDSDLLTTEGQRAAEIRDLPQVLLLHPQEDTAGNKSNDLITPTVATFQGRARALSFQPMGTAPVRSVSDSHALNAPGVGRRQDVWEEAMHQLTERLTRPCPQVSSSDSQSFEARAPFKIIASTQLFASASASSTSLPQLTTDVLHEHSEPRASALSPIAQSSPLPGLFYDNWVERVDGAVDGDLGRRGSTFHLSEQSPASPARSTLTLGPHGGGAADTMTRTWSSSSGSTMLGSVASDEHSLQVLHESEWPLPQSRGPVLGASESFFSVLSPQPDDTDSVEGDDEEVVDQIEPGTSRDARSSHPLRAGTALAPVRLSRSHTVSTIPRISEPPTAAASPRSADRPESGTSDSMSGWADLAQRLRSPGSMRLLCLAASSWSADELITTQDPGLSASSSIGPLPTGLAIPATSPTSSTGLARSQSLSGLIRSIDSWKDELQERRFEPATLMTSALSKGEEPVVEMEQPKRLTRKKATMLGPIHVPSTKLPVDDANAAEGDSGRERDNLAPSKAVTGVKRSLSYIFDLPSPIGPGPGLGAPPF